jgi:hypothetical protein
MSCTFRANIITWEWRAFQHFDIGWTLCKDAFTDCAVLSDCDDELSKPVQLSSLSGGGGVDLLVSPIASPLMGSGGGGAATPCTRPSSDDTEDCGTHDDSPTKSSSGG